jgi:hypothetical protein
MLQSSVRVRVRVESPENAGSTGDEFFDMPL